MKTISDDDVTSRRLAESLLDMHAQREIVERDPMRSVRWFEHDYPNSVALWNYHPEFEIHLIRRGSGRYIIGDRIGRFEPGHLAIIGSGLPHDWVSDLEPGERIEGRDAVIQFDWDWFVRIAELMPELGEVRPVLEDAARGVLVTGETAREAAAIIESMGEVQGIDQLARLVSLFGTLARAPSHEKELLARQWFSPVADSMASRAVELGLDYILKNTSSTIRMSEAARLAQMSEPTFSRFFKRASGRTFTEMVRMLRLAHARKLLIDSDEPISSICYQVGFSNLSNFNRQFKAETGVAPGVYRRLHARGRAHETR